MFDTGRSTLTPSERQRLKDTFEIFRACEVATLYVRGYASSAPYKEENEYRNLLLANGRAIAVRNELKTLVGLTPQHAEWSTHTRMAEMRRLRDLDANGRIIKALERLNRRAEVFWNDSHCISDGAGPAPQDAPRNTIAGR
jgi:flagellar motor protein MotB